jgi:hypothetical protein
MKKTILIFLLSVSIYSQAQVGINPTGAAPHPSAMLDVNSTNKGLLLPRTTDPTANITAPAAGLMTYNTTTNTPNYYNGSQWQSMSPQAMGFKNVMYFRNNDTWMVPAGVSKIMIEAWGGGGGAGHYSFYTGTIGQIIDGGGAGAGAYASVSQDITAGAILNLYVGAAGNAGTTNYLATSGGDSYVTSSGNYFIYANGGTSGYYGSGGNVGSLGTGVAGENGHELEISYSNSNASSYNMILKLGSGGSAYKGGHGGKGQFLVLQNTASTLYTTLNLQNRLDGGFPGGGGACAGITTTGGNGGKGIIIIYY